MAKAIYTKRSLWRKIKKSRAYKDSLEWLRKQYENGFGQGIYPL